MLKRNSAFSLIEISIILIIIGVLLAAATMSKDLIDNGKLKKVVVEIENIKTALKTFHGSYDELPGDFSLAEEYWGATNTNNGDGDGLVEYPNESFYAFSHLDLAKVLHGEYSPNIDNYYFQSKYPAVIRLLNTEELSGFQDEGVNVLQIGRNNTADDPVFSPEEAKQIDLKFDDGGPNSGRVKYRTTENTTAENCTNNSDNYYVANTNLACNLVIRTDI